MNDDESTAAVLGDVEIFKKSGGRTIVENSNYGLQRNVPLMKQISESTGVNVIAGTGTISSGLLSIATHVHSIRIFFQNFHFFSEKYINLCESYNIIIIICARVVYEYFSNSSGYYVASAQSASTLGTSKEEMYNLMHEELETGCAECPDAKAGFIGEVGSTWPIEGKL